MVLRYRLLTAYTAQAQALNDWENFVSSSRHNKWQSTVKVTPRNLHNVVKRSQTRRCSLCYLGAALFAFSYTWFARRFMSALLFVLFSNRLTPCIVPERLAGQSATDRRFELLRKNWKKPFCAGVPTPVSRETITLQNRVFRRCEELEKLCENLLSYSSKLVTFS